MNAKEFDQQMQGMVQRGVEQGLQRGEMGLHELIGILELHKIAVASQVIQAQIKAAQPQILPFRRPLPPIGGGS
jgi:hypothetical protein